MKCASFALYWVLAGGLAFAPKPASAKPSRHIRVLPAVFSEMVKIPAGSFAMGFPDDPVGIDDFISLCAEDYGILAAGICSKSETWQSSMPNRQVYLSSYEMDRYEVTMSEYRSCVRAGRCDIGPLIYGDQKYNAPALPLVNATWADANQYCAWRNKRLPTDAEWEKAASGTSGWFFPWGPRWGSGGSNHGKLFDEAMLVVMAQIRDLRPSENYRPDDSDGYVRAAPPGTMRFGDSIYGAANMSGNVREWVADYYSDSGYSDLSLSNPFRSVPLDSDRRRSVRGGSWTSTRTLGVNFNRQGRNPTVRYSETGFRCARSPAVQ